MKAPSKHLLVYIYTLILIITSLPSKSPLKFFINITKMKISLVYFSDINDFYTTLISVFTVVRALVNDKFIFLIKIYAYDFPPQIPHNITQHIRFLQTLNDRASIQLIRFNVSMLKSEFPNATTGSYPLIVLCRLLIPRFVFEQYILYLDSDVLCGRDFSLEIFDAINSKNQNSQRVLFGVRDIGTSLSKMRKYYKTMGFNIRNYINAGILFMKNSYILGKLLNQSIQYVNTHKSRFSDQDAINYAFNKTYKGMLPHEFNCHFCRREKMNQVVFFHGRKIRFWKKMITKYNNQYEAFIQLYNT
ncbi:hypothetical protein TRFO_40270 [Tritrichomonas foetus]|uniref:Glycosyl transferase family 8 protein n=1 Tax=Tritrichomonas foetus TaxID=1144522 RepID=A0A1J4J5P0_9EUKA|nr:hypothetical protein TRFO_40270 [Tritrichomonas foetus]|eukprot:OHS93463.1 hypothetical protein TRFO_40270 [Tritrichomonas foetus]